MLILLGTSTLAAALVPAPSPREDDTTTDTTSPRTSPVPTGGELVRASVDADANRPQRIRAALGDQVSIIVRSRRTTQIEVKGLGLLEDVLPLSPARFDVLAIRSGRFEIRRVEPERRVGVL